MADAPLILETDYLDEAYPKINKAIQNANESLNKHADTDAKADDAIQKADAANDKADFTQQQLDQVAGSSTIDPAVAQMKVDTEGVTHASPDARLRSDYVKVNEILAAKANQDEVEQLVLHAGNPSSSSAEIAQSRGAYPVLNDRITVQETTVTPLITYKYEDYNGSFLASSDTNFLNKDTGADTVSTAYKYRKIDVKSGEKYKITTRVPGNTNIKGLFFWNSDGSFKNSDLVYDATNGGYFVEYEVTIPVGVTIMAVVSMNTYAGYKIRKASLNPITTKKISDIDNVKSILTQFTYEVFTNFSEYNNLYQIYAYGGVVTTPTSAVSGGKSVIAACEPGDVFKVSGILNGVIKKAIFLTAGMVMIGFEETVTGAFDNDITTPNNCYNVIFTTTNQTSNPLTIRKKTASYHSVNEISKTVSERTFDNTEESDRLYAIESRLGFKWKPFDVGKIVLIIDDGLPNISDIAAICAKYNFPLSIAMPSSQLVKKANNGQTIAEVSLAIQNSGGEILSHGIDYNVITEQTTDTEAEKIFRESKKTLRSAGLRVNGYVRAGGTTNGYTALDYLTKFLPISSKYYRYGYRLGTDLNYDIDRYNITALTDEQIQTYINSCATNKSLLVFMAHLNDSELSSFSLSRLENMIASISNRTDVEGTILKSLFDQYGGV